MLSFSHPIPIDTHDIGPYFGWKALLKPTAAGGNYTIFAECTGCTGTGEYSNATISNVAFGDVWHCSGQSNMWLPLSSSFTINATIGNITSTTAPKYRNIRMMAGNSGDGNSVTSNPWMTALQAASLLPVGNRGSLYRKIVDFGATVRNKKIRIQKPHCVLRRHFGSSRRHCWGVVYRSHPVAGSTTPTSPPSLGSAASCLRTGYADVRTLI